MDVALLVCAPIKEKRIRHFLLFVFCLDKIAHCEKKEESSGDGRSWLNPYTVSIERHSASAPTSAVLSPSGRARRPLSLRHKKDMNRLFRIYIYIKDGSPPHCWWRHHPFPSFQCLFSFLLLLCCAAVWVTAWLWLSVCGSSPGGREDEPSAPPSPTRHYVDDRLPQPVAAAAASY